MFIKTGEEDLEHSRDHVIRSDLQRSALSGNVCPDTDQTQRADPASGCNLPTSFNNLKTAAVDQSTTKASVPEFLIEHSAE